VIELIVYTISGSTRNRFDRAALFGFARRWGIVNRLPGKHRSFQTNTPGGRTSPMKLGRLEGSMIAQFQNANVILIDRFMHLRVFCLHLVRATWASLLIAVLSVIANVRRRFSRKIQSQSAGAMSATHLAKSPLPSLSFHFMTPATRFRIPGSDECLSGEASRSRSSQICGVLRSQPSRSVRISLPSILFQW
jgi:hypothetical protein